MEERRFKRLSDAKFNVILEGDRTVKGDISCEGNLKIGCMFDGLINSDGVVFITKNGEVQANIKCFALVIEGKVTGSTVAANKIEVRRSGVLSGDIQCDMLAMEEKSSVTEPEGWRKDGKSPVRVFVFKERRKEILEEIGE